jgi:hypothetical protein
MSKLQTKRLAIVFFQQLWRGFKARPLSPLGGFLIMVSVIVLVKTIKSEIMPFDEKTYNILLSFATFYCGNILLK